VGHSIEQADDFGPVIDRGCQRRADVEEQGEPYRGRRREAESGQHQRDGGLTRHRQPLDDALNDTREQRDHQVGEAHGPDRVEGLLSWCDLGSLRASDSSDRYRRPRLN